MDLAPHWAAFKRATKEEDLFVFISRGLTYFGLFMVSLLHFKLSSNLSTSDAAFAVAAIFLFLSRRPPPRAPRTPAWYVGAFLFLLAGIIASSQSQYKSSSLLVVGNAVYLFFVLQYLLRQQLGTPRHLRRGLAAYVLGASLSAFVAILQSTAHVLTFAPSSGVIGGGASRAIGLSNQPNLAGVAFAIGIVFAIGLILDDGLRRHRLLGVCVVVLAMAQLLSGSVSGFACTIVGLLVFFVARGVRLKTVVIVFLSFAFVYVLVFGVVARGSNLDPITRIEKTTNSQTGTLSLRENTWRAAWTGIIDKPITGHGLDQPTLALYWDRYLYVYYPPHNLILLYWFGGGIFMLAALFIMVGSALSRCLRGRGRGRGGIRDPMSDVILSACVITLLFSMAAPELVDRWFWLPFLLAMCLRAPETTSALTAATVELPASAGNGAPRRVRGTVGQSASTTARGRHVARS